MFCSSQQQQQQQQWHFIVIIVISSSGWQRLQQQYLVVAVVSSSSSSSSSSSQEQYVCSHVVVVVVVVVASKQPTLTVMRWSCMSLTSREVWRKTSKSRKVCTISRGLRSQKAPEPTLTGYLFAVLVFSSNSPGSKLCTCYV